MKAISLLIRLWGLGYRTTIIFVAFLLFTSPAHALKPKVHIYIGLKIVGLNLEACNIELEPGGLKFSADPRACNAVRNWPGYFLAGTIGPDGFPDIAFGQMKIHPDTLYTYSGTDHDGTMVTEGADEKTITNDWLQHLWNMALREETMEKRDQAMAFVLGYLAHAAGDMWSHTLVNQYAGGSWPEDYNSGRNIIKTHMIVESIIGNHAPDIKSRVTSSQIGGIKIPTDFLYRAFIEDEWAAKHGAGSFIGYFTDLRGYLRSKMPDNDISALDWLKYHYLDCWIGEINKGLKAWFNTSGKIANDLFVLDETGNVINYLEDFKRQHLSKMLGANPIDLVNRCMGIPEWVNIALLDPATILEKLLDEIKEETLDRIWDPISTIQDNFVDYLFEKAFGLTYEEFKNPETYAPGILGDDITREIEGLMRLNSSGYFDDDNFAIIYNTTVLNKLILFNASNLDQMLFRYNVGNIYLPMLTPNVMLGFLKSLDGNHQWRIHAPSEPITQPSRSFSINGMPLWVDCLARKNFFKKVFKDWTRKDVSMLYKDSETCCPSSFLYCSHLPPVTTGFRLLTNNDMCTPSYAEFTLTNHQETIDQAYALYVTVETPKDILNNTHLPLNDYEKGMPMTEWCNKVVPPGPIEYSPIIIRPENISYKNIFFYKVRRGILQRSSKTCKDEIVLVQLPNCDNVKALVRAYVLREVNTAKKPIEENNTKIPPNPLELLSDPVKAYFNEDYVIKCDPCTIPPCEGSMQVTYKLKKPVTITVPCQKGCCRDKFDADDDTLNNAADNCPLNPNPRQEDCNYDLIGDACQICAPDILREWVNGFLPDPRAESMFHYMIDRGLIGPVIIDPISPCDLPNCMQSLPIEGNFFTPLSRPIKLLTQKWIQGSVSDKIFFRNIKLMLGGLSQKESNFRVTQATLAASRRKDLFRGNELACLTLGLPPDAKDTLEIVIPRAMLDAKNGGKDAKYRVFIDGKEVKIAEANDTEFRVISIRVIQGAKSIQIFGNRMGPK